MVVEIKVDLYRLVHVGKRGFCDSALSKQVNTTSCFCTVWHHQREEKIAFCSIWQSQFPCYLFPCTKATVLWQYFYEQKHEICGNFEELKLQLAFGKCFSYFDGLKLLRTSWKVLLYSTMSNVCWQIFDLRDGGQQSFLSAKIFAKHSQNLSHWYLLKRNL